MQTIYSICAWTGFAIWTFALMPLYMVPLSVMMYMWESQRRRRLIRRRLLPPSGDWQVRMPKTYKLPIHYRYDRDTFSPFIFKLIRHDATQHKPDQVQID